MSWFVRLSWLASIIVALSLGLIFGRRTGQRAVPPEIVGTIGDHNVSRQDLNQKLKIFERRALELFCYEYIVEQEALRRNLHTRVKLSDTTFEGFDAKVQDLLEQIALNDVPAAYQEQVYQAFSRELARYDIETAYLLSEASKNSFESEMKEGSDFKALKAKYATELPGNPPQKGLTVYEIGTKYGVDVKKRAGKLSTGQCSQVFPYGDGYLVFRVTKLRNSFKDLQPEIQKIVAASRKQLVINSLLSKQLVVSKLKPSRLYRNPAPSEMLDVIPTSKSPTNAKVGSNTPAPSLPTPGKVPTKGDPTLPMKYLPPLQGSPTPSPTSSPSLSTSKTPTSLEGGH